MLTAYVSVYLMLIPRLPRLTCRVPCLDNLWEKCTRGLGFVVPKLLEDTANAAGAEGDDTNGMPTVVITAGNS